MSERVKLRDQPCRRCGHGGAWLLRPVRELGHDMVVESVDAPALLVPREHRLGWYEAAVCARCGHTLFWAREYAPERPAATVAPCHACDATTAWIIDAAPDRVDRLSTSMRVQLAPPRPEAGATSGPEARVRPGGGGWNATLGVGVCCRCRLASWSCRPDPRPEGLPAGRTSPRRCVRCGGPQWLVTLRDHSHEGSVERAVAIHRVMWFSTPRGRFEADVCCACSTVDWYGMDLEELRVDEGDGVFWLERRGAVGGHSGPYR